MGLIGLNRRVPIGVDVECTTREVETSDIVERFFAPAEREVWQDIPPVESNAAFYRAWTRKEAYVKARGDGLSHDSSRYAITFREVDRSKLLVDEIDPTAPARYKVIPVAAPPDYEAACVLQISPQIPVELNLHSWT